ncbi:MAG: hypothetical protein ABSH51_18695 [Solirubrobacteraceae bacterium]
MRSRSAATVRSRPRTSASQASWPSLSSTRCASSPTLSIATIGQPSCTAGGESTRVANRMITGGSASAGAA